MKKLFIYGMFVASALLTACNEDFNKDVAAPQSWEQEELAAQLGFSAKGVELIDLGKVTEETVKICSFTAPTAEAATYEMVLSAEDKKITLPMDKDGKVSKAAFQDAVASIFGRKPVERLFKGAAQAIVVVDGQAMRASATAVDVKVIPAAPVIEKAYYLVGNPVGWKWDTGLAFTHSGKDVYEDSHFEIIVQALKGEDLWFKIIPQSTHEKATANGGNVDGEVVLGIANNGDGKLEGTLVAGADGAIKATAGKYYKIELDMMEYTYKITPMAYAPMLTLVDGTNVEKVLSLVDNAGVYKGFAYLGAGFTFSENAEESYNSTQIKTLGAGLTAGAGGKIVPTPGYYQVILDLAAGKIEVKTIQWGIIGSATPGGWDASTPMVLDKATGKWSVTTTLKDGELKFRANDNWDINLGGKPAALTTENGDNMPVTAGEYTIVLDANNAKKMYCTITKK